MAISPQDEDYKVLQAMRTEISGLVESKNRLDLEIKQLEEDKAQAELEANAAKTKLDDVSGEWSAKMRKLIDYEKRLNADHATLEADRSQFDAFKKEKEDALKYLEEQALSEKSTIQQNLAESDKALKEVRDKEQQLAHQEQGLRELEAELEGKRQHLVALENTLDTHATQVSQAKEDLEKQKAALVAEEERVRGIEGQVAKASSESKERMEKKERELRARESMIADREREIEKQRAILDPFLTKKEADEVRQQQAQVAEDRRVLNRERSAHVQEKHSDEQKLYHLREEIKSAEATLASLRGRVTDIEKREKGVADSEAGVQAREKQLVFEIAKFKKRVKDAKMEEVINESG